MTSPMNQYADRRLARLAAVPWLRQVPAGAGPARYRADQLLATEDGRAHVERYLGAPGVPASQGDEEVIPGLRLYHVAGLDVMGAVHDIHRQLTPGTRVASPNHVYLGSPFNHGGPYGPPAPTAAATLPPPVDDGRLAQVSIIDTGLWSATALPAGYLRKGGVDYEEITDADNDGVLDGDVGHANFIGGVVASHAPRSELSVLKVLDTFGVCTDDQLAAAIMRIDPGTHVINLSMGGYTMDDAPPIGVAMALETVLAGRDRVVVAAAGNDGNGTNPFWPAAFAGTGAGFSAQVVAVAAHDGQGLCAWSNTGPWVTLAAPGADIRSTFINHPLFPEGWALWSGTSFAAPRVGAEIADLITATTGPTAALAQVMSAVRAGGARFGGHPGLV